MTDTPTGGLARIPLSATDLNRKDFVSDAEVRWCPGCGDYVILAAVQGLLPKLGIKRENLVVVSGIGCSSRFPYYLDSYGFHSIHGRAPAIATGIATAREDLSVWVITGDGDALSIGGNHLIHALRRNVNINILLFNNRIYGLTKGQYSPTSESGKITKSSPLGSLDTPFNPVSVALGAEATFVARVLDSDRKLMPEVLQQAAEHRGASLVEIYQNCPIFNEGAFDGLKGAEGEAHLLRLEPGEPIRSADEVVVWTPGGVALVPENEANESDIVLHDPTRDDASYAFALSRITGKTPVGVFRNVARPTYDDSAREQVRVAGGDSLPDATQISNLLRGDDTWLVS